MHDVGHELVPRTEEGKKERREKGRKGEMKEWEGREEQKREFCCIIGDLHHDTRVGGNTLGKDIIRIVVIREKRGRGNAQATGLQLPFPQAQ